MSEETGGATQGWGCQSQHSVPRAQWSLDPDGQFHPTTFEGAIGCYCHLGAGQAPSSDVTAPGEPAQGPLLYGGPVRPGGLGSSCGAAGWRPSPAGLQSAGPAGTVGRVRGEAVLSGLCSSEARLTGGWINKDALCSQAGHVESSAVTPVSSPFFIFLFFVRRDACS